MHCICMHICILYVYIHTYIYTHAFSYNNVVYLSNPPSLFVFKISQNKKKNCFCFHYFYFFLSLSPSLFRSYSLSSMCIGIIQYGKQSLFTTNPCQHPIVILKDVQYNDLKTMVDFMYYGEVNVSQEQLPHILKTAEMLKIKGLAEMPDPVSLTKSDSKSSDQTDPNAGKFTFNSIFPVWNYLKFNFIFFFQFSKFNYKLNSVCDFCIRINVG